MWRRRMRDAEQERDQLRGLVDQLERTEVERRAGAAGMAMPSDLWAIGTELGSLRGEDGQLDAEAVEARVAEVLKTRPTWRKGGHTRATGSAKATRRRSCASGQAGVERAVEGTGMSEQPLDQVLALNLGGFAPQNPVRPPWQRQTLREVQYAYTGVVAVVGLEHADKTQLRNLGVPSDWQDDVEFDRLAAGWAIAPPT